MKKIIRLTESDLVRLVKRVISEQSQTKISTSAESLLQNKSTSLNTSIGVKNLPSCFSKPDYYGGGLSSKEIDWVIDQMDFPVNNDNPGRLLRYLQGSGIPGAFGGSSQNNSIEDRVFESNGLWYPAVEGLRSYYNADESFETLYSSVTKKDFSDSKSLLIAAYQKWINCVNNPKKI